MSRPPTSDIVSGLKGTPGYLGLLVMTHTGSVVETAGELQASQAANLLYILEDCAHISKPASAPGKEEGFRKLTITFDDFIIALTMDKSLVYALKKKT